MLVRGLDRRLKISLKLGIGPEFFRCQTMSPITAANADSWWRLARAFALERATLVYRYRAFLKNVPSQGHGYNMILYRVKKTYNEPALVQI